MSNSDREVLKLFMDNAKTYLYPYLLRKSGHSVLHLNIALVNHSCAPNATIVEDEDDAVYVVIIPRFRHGEVNCKEAKEEETLPRPISEIKARQSEGVVAMPVEFLRPDRARRFQGGLTLDIEAIDIEPDIETILVSKSDQPKPGRWEYSM